VVDIEDATGQRSTLNAVRTGGHWRIEVPAFVSGP
jgi:hypothetical protein